jgi:hypothetical protein
VQAPGKHGESGRIAFVKAGQKLGPLAEETERFVVERGETMREKRHPPVGDDGREKI